VSSLQAVGPPLVIVIANAAAANVLPTLWSLTDLAF
jgi:hypothetical protein